MEPNMTLEQAYDLLEKAVNRLENEALPMEESVALYVRAGELMSFCMEQLNGYNRKIEATDRKLAQYFTEEPNE